jgi:hypothetical protein
VNDPPHVVFDTNEPRSISMMELMLPHERAFSALEYCAENYPLFIQRLRVSLVLMVSISDTEALLIYTPIVSYL